MQVMIPSALQSYTGHSKVEAVGATLNRSSDLGQRGADLGRCYPGIRFRMIDERERIRPHIRFFFDGEQIHDPAQALNDDGELIIAQALSGG